MKTRDTDVVTEERSLLGSLLRMSMLHRMRTDSLDPSLNGGSDNTEDLRHLATT